MKCRYPSNPSMNPLTTSQVPYNKLNEKFKSKTPYLFLFQYQTLIYLYIIIKPFINSNHQLLDKDKEHI